MQRSWPAAATSGGVLRTGVTGSGRLLMIAHRDWTRILTPRSLVTWMPRSVAICRWPTSSRSVVRMTDLDQHETIQVFVGIDVGRARIMPSP